MCVTTAVKSSKPVNGANTAFSVSTQIILINNSTPIHSSFKSFYHTKSKDTCSCRKSKWEAKEKAATTPHTEITRVNIPDSSSQDTDTYVHTDTERETELLRSCNGTVLTLQTLMARAAWGPGRIGVACSILSATYFLIIISTSLYHFSSWPHKLALYKTPFYPFLKTL